MTVNTRRNQSTPPVYPHDTMTQDRTRKVKPKTTTFSITPSESKEMTTPTQPPTPSAAVLSDVSKTPRQNVLVLDGAWSWLVCLANFALLLNAATFGRAISINFLNFVEIFDSTITTTSLIFTFHLLSISLAAVIGTTILVPLTGERVACTVGSVGCALCTVGIGLVPNIGTFLFFMTFKGACVGISFVPAISLISQYFDKHRSLATALANCGLSLGVIATPPLLAIIIDEYGLRGSFLILAALEMQVVPIVMFLRPINSYSAVVASMEDSEELGEGDDCTIAEGSFDHSRVSKHEFSSSSLSVSQDVSPLVQLKLSRRSSRRSRRPPNLSLNDSHSQASSMFYSLIVPSTPIEATTIGIDRDENTRRSLRGRPIKESITVLGEETPPTKSERKNVPLKICIYDTESPRSTSSAALDNGSKAGLGVNIQMKKKLLKVRGRSASEADKHVPNAIEKDKLPLSACLSYDCLPPRHQRIASDNMSANNSPFKGPFKIFNFPGFTSPKNTTRRQCNGVSPNGTPKSQTRRRYHPVAHLKYPIDQRQKVNSLGVNASSWSLVSTPSQIPVDVGMFAYTPLDHSTTCPEVTVEIYEPSDQSGQDNGDKNEKGCPKVKDNIVKTFNVQILRSWAPLTLFASSVAGVLVQYVVTYLPTIASKAELSGEQISLLLTISGILDLVSRLALGAFMDMQILQPTTTVAICQMVMGIMCFLGPFYTNYDMLIFLAVISGLFAGARQTLGTLLTIQFIGAEDFLKALGFQTMFGTLSLAAHHPILCAVLETTGSFMIPLYYVGAALCLSSLLLMLEPLAKKMDAKSKPIIDNMSD